MHATIQYTRLRRLCCICRVPCLVKTLTRLCMETVDWLTKWGIVIIYLRIVLVVRLCQYVLVVENACRVTKHLHTTWTKSLSVDHGNVSNARLCWVQNWIYRCIICIVFQRRNFHMLFYLKFLKIFLEFLSSRTTALWNEFLQKPRKLSKLTKETHSTKSFWNLISK